MPSLFVSKQISLSISCHYHSFPMNQLKRLQEIQNALARADTPKYSYGTPSLKSFHWLKVEKRIKKTHLVPNK